MNFADNWTFLVGGNVKFQGIIDWDLAHYGYAMDDIAEFTFEFIPFQPNLPEITGEELSNASLIERLEVFCQAYGNLKPDKILEHIPVYLTRMNADLRKQASLGIEPFVSFVAGGIADKLDRHKAYVLSHWLNY